MQNHFHIYVVIMLHLGFAAALLHWLGNERFSRLFAGAWLIEAVRAVVLLPAIHSIGNAHSHWFCATDVLCLFAVWMLFAAIADLTGHRLSRSWMLLYFLVSLPLILLGRYAGPGLLTTWFEVPVERGPKLAVLFNLTVMFVPATLTRVVFTWWLYKEWKKSRLSGALIAFAFGIPYSIMAIIVPAQFYFSWYPPYVRLMWCMRVFGFSMGILMLVISRTENARRKGDALFRTLFEQAAIGVAYVNSDDGLIRQVNRRFVEIVQGTTSELGDNSVYRLFGAEEIQKGDLLLEGKIREFSFEKQFRHVSGASVWGNLTVSNMSIQGRQQPAWIVIIEDITDRKVATDSLQDHAEQLELALEAGQMGTFVWDLPAQHMSMSDSLLQLHGFQPSEARPGYQQLLRRVHPDDFPIMQQEIERVRRQQCDFRDQYRVVWPDGSTHWVQRRGRFVCDESGDAVRMIGVVAVIDDIKRNEEELRESNTRLTFALEQLEETQKKAIGQERLNALGQMAAGVAHDINNALTPLMTYAGLLQSEERLSKQGNEWTRLIQVGVNDTAETVRRLNHFYRESHNRELLESIDLADIVQQTVKLTRPKWQDQARTDRQQIRVSTKINARPRVKGEASQLRSVLTNLIFNSCEAIRDEGVIELQVDCDESVASVCVTDTGTGMTAHQLQHCLEPFYTSKSKGSGLGLSECYGIIRQHGGQLQIESSLGAATAIRFTLPVDRSDQVRSEGALPQRNQSCTDSIPIILCIDDDPGVSKATAAMLKSLPAKAETVASGPDGLRLLNQKHFDLVLCDQGLPEMDGIEVLNKIKQQWPELPVIMVSGWSLPTIEEGPLPDDFIEKPFPIELLFSTIRKHLRSR